MKSYEYATNKIIEATTKCINEIKKAFRKEYLTGKIKASRKTFK